MSKPMPARRSRTPQPRTAQPDRTRASHLNSGAQKPEDLAPGEEARTEQSRRGECAYAQWTSTKRRLAAAESEIAAALDEELRAAWVAGDESLSNVAVARACGVDEKIVRRWRDGERAIPVGALLLMPATLAQRLIGRLQDRRTLSPHRRGVPQLRAALDHLSEPVPPSERREVLRALLDAQRRLGELVASIVDSQQGE